MSKIGKTKKDILKILSKKQHTITDVSNILNLSPSTVKQHFDELVRIGAIEQVENEFIKRWKYYKTVPSFNINDFKKEKNIPNLIPYAVGSVIIIALIGVLFYSNYINITPKSLVNPNYSLTVQLTDPPHVPANTTALILNYRSISVNVLKDNNTYQWINVSGSGSVNLMSLVNITQIMGNAFLNSSYKVVGVALNVNSTYIKINNITYPVSVPEKMIYANLSNQTRINSNSSLLIDFSPTVSSIYLLNSTLFVMTPSLNAMFYGNYSYNNKTDYEVGKRFNLNDREFLALRPNKNLVITSANIIQYGTVSNILNYSTKINLTIKNNGNKTIMIKQILLSGELTSHVILKNDSILAIRKNGFQGLSINISKINISKIGRTPFHIIITTNISNKMNITDSKAYNSLNWHMHYSKLSFDIIHNYHNFNNTNNFNNTDTKLIFNLTGEDYSEEHVGFNMVSINQLMFLVSNNGTMILPGNGPISIPFNNSGYSIAPGASVTLTFNGSILCGDGRIIGSLSNDSNYSIAVIGNKGSFAYANVISS